MVGTTERGFVAEGFEEYIGRLRKSAKVEIMIVKGAGQGDAAHQQHVESERLLAALKPGDRVVALDERGKAMDSVTFAERIGVWRDQGVRECVFIIGGAYGLHNDVRERADLVLALSPMTFTHQVVRVVFAEQLYRAFTILAGRPYHH
jgi:23S rRNA (pseudouridine1915-N3)-methyltransferase